VIGARRPAVWDVVSDPYQLPRWWPKVSRVEGVQERRRGSGTLWTKVLKTQAGRDVRADYRCLYSKEHSAYGWEQEIEGSPFAKVFKTATTAIELEDAATDRTRVTIVVDQKLRGMSRTGGFMVRRATSQQLDEALESLADLFEGGAAPAVSAGEPPPPPMEPEPREPPGEKRELDA
jgi:uncharacterized protein YndB with AHSA1/START domain